ncbi:predicted protein [Nematostella vectensis]|uniref:TNFR-Cys domain-containing protein n=1 Tax=Nematostella vectensis TaxID=45351 RepID=A7STY1_NEMVE|nr:predicted protein [Nematostella vectensis]|eukprot:XP_001624931.1 predicted protein [Nematostella vectensis]
MTDVRTGLFMPDTWAILPTSSAPETAVATAESDTEIEPFDNTTSVPESLVLLLVVVLMQAPILVIGCNSSIEITLVDENKNETHCRSCDLTHCDLGFGFSVRCGGTYPTDTRVECVPCIAGTNFSNVRDYSMCQACTICGENRLKTGKCDVEKDTTVCLPKCNEGHYFDNSTAKCPACEKCCHDGKDVHVSSCAKISGKNCKTRDPCTTAPSTDSKEHLPDHPISGWKIAFIVIGCLVFFVIVVTCLFNPGLRRKVLSRCRRTLYRLRSRHSMQRVVNGATNNNLGYLACNAGVNPVSLSPSPPPLPVFNLCFFKIQDGGYKSLKSLVLLLVVVLMQAPILVIGCNSSIEITLVDENKNETHCRSCDLTHCDLGFGFSVRCGENIATQARRNSDPTPRDCPDSRQSSIGFGRSQSHPGANNSSPCSNSDSCARIYSVDGLKSYLTRKLKGYGLLHCKSNNLNALKRAAQANGQAGHGCIGDEHPLAIRQPPPQTQNMQMLQMVTLYHASNGNLELNNIVGGNKGRIINPVISETLDQILREHCGDAVFNNPEVEVKLQHLPEKKT